MAAANAWTPWHRVPSTPADGDFLPCAADSEPQPLPDSAALKLQRLCPDVFAEGAERGYCCTSKQVDNLEAQVAAGVMFFEGCPACSRNFRHIFCSLACSPDQSLFTNVTETQAAPAPGGDTEGGSVVQSLDVSRAPPSSALHSPRYSRLLAASASTRSSTCRPSTAPLFTTRARMSPTAP